MPQFTNHSLLLYFLDIHEHHESQISLPTNPHFTEEKAKIQKGQSGLPQLEELPTRLRSPAAHVGNIAFW